MLGKSIPSRSAGALQKDWRNEVMSARKSVVRFLAHALMVVGAIFVVTVFLAAMPGHNSPSVPAVGPQDQQSVSPGASTSASQEMPGMDHSQMQMDADEEANERAAVTEMSHLHGGGPHLHMTEMHARTSADAQRANEIVTQLRAGIEKYKDYHVALNDGYRIFLPNIPQPEYHFTSYKNGFMAAMRFDPSQPTSLLYRKTFDGFQLVGAMYTMPKRASEGQLNERVPLSVAMWHLHTNLCMPPKDQRQTADWTKFGLKGSISTPEACDAAGGNFHPSIFGWMVHVYPYEDSLDKIFAMHHHD
jgi:hypothetical protein